jgi:hypothetical protein
MYYAWLHTPQLSLPSEPAQQNLTGTLPVKLERVAQGTVVDGHGARL